MTITLEELKAKIARGVPGCPIPPEKPPLTFYKPDPNCEKCSGTGWSWSDVYERYFPCSCSIGRSPTPERTLYPNDRD